VSFVAAHATVTAGTSIGMCSVVGANSVVTRDIPAGVVAVGSPAAPKRTLPAWWLGSV
jgi:maltose O-acetyltransferase